MSFSLGRKIFLSFIATIGLLSTVFVILFKNFENVKSTNNLVEHTQEVLSVSNNVFMDILNIETGVRGYLLTGNKRFLEPFTISSKTIKANLEILTKLTKDNSQQQLRINLLKKVQTKRLFFLQKLVDSKENNTLKEYEVISILGKGRRLSDKTRRLMNDINAEEFKQLIQRKKENAESNLDTKLIFLLLIALIVIILAFVSIILRNQKEINKFSEELKKSSDLFHGLFDHNPASLSISRITDGSLVKVNDSFLQLFGFDHKEEVIGKTFKELRLYVNPNYESEIIQSLNENKTIKDYEIETRTKHGEIKWVSDSVLSQEVNNEMCLFSVAIDITHRKKAERQLMAVNSELESFTYSVSHDLRAPLRAINGYATILKEDYNEKLDSEGLSSLAAIQKNSKRMGDLIDDLLAFSRLGRKEVVTSEINMTALVKSVKEEEMISHTNEIEFVFDELLPGKGQQALIKQVWTNLISNAIKYSKHQSKIIVEIDSFYKDNRVIYSIRDNGVGFDMQYYDKLFGVFQRLHSNEEFEGTGIGLAIVQKIVNRHDGKVWAESKLNEGTCFYFSLPTINTLTKII